MPAIQASAPSTVFPVGTYSGQQAAAAPFPVDDTAQSVTVALDRSGDTLWSQSSTAARVDVLLSIKGGAFQPFFYFIVAPQDKTNANDTGSAGSATVPLPPGTGRQLQISLTVANGLVHTSVNAQWQ